MARVLLIKCGRPGTANFAGVPPLGLMSIASVLRSQGHAVKLLDTVFAPSGPALLGPALAFAPDIVGLSALSIEAKVLGEVATLLSREIPASKMIVGGPHATGCPEGVLALPGATAAVVGEGEATASELVRVLESGGDPREVSGTAVRSGGDGEALPLPRSPIADLDSLPFPAWDLVDVNAYGKLPNIAGVGGRRHAFVVTSRGCPFHCSYCHRIMGKRFRAHGPERVAGEMEHLASTLGVSDIVVLDDNFNFDRERADRILDTIIARRLGLRLYFPVGLRGDLLDEALLQKFRDAGTRFIAMGIETASPRLQRKIGKDLDLSKIRENIAIAARLGIFVSGFFMMGLPTETREEMEETVDSAVRSDLHQALFFFLVPFPGSELYDRLTGKRDLEGAAPPRFDTMDLFQGSLNLSHMSEAALRKGVRRAYRRFYLDPKRAYRILRDHPGRGALPRQAARAIAQMVRGVWAERRAERRTARRAQGKPWSH